MASKLPVIIYRVANREYEIGKGGKGGKGAYSSGSFFHSLHYIYKR